MATSTTGGKTQATSAKKANKKTDKKGAESALKPAKASINKSAAESAKKAGTPKKEDVKTGKKNKLGVKNSLVNNINVKKKKGTSRLKRKSTVSKKAYKDMENKWQK